MNVETGEVRSLADLSQAERESGDWQPVPKRRRAVAEKRRTGGFLTPVERAQLDRLQKQLAARAHAKKKRRRAIAKASQRRNRRG